MNNITSLFSPNYKNLEQAKAIKLLEDIYGVAEEQNKGCEYCKNEQDIEYCCYIRKEPYGYQLMHRDDYGDEWSEIINFCPMCGRDLRKEEL